MALSSGEVLRIILTGLAGGGKTEVCREIAESGPGSNADNADIWLNRTMICAPTGTACNNLSELDAETLDRCTAIYNTDLTDEELKKLCAVWQGKPDC